MGPSSRVDQEYPFLEAGSSGGFCQSGPGLHGPALVMQRILRYRGVLHVESELQPEPGQGLAGIAGVAPVPAALKFAETAIPASGL